MAFRPHKFGRYIIVDPIAVGGMAEIYRARLAAAKEGPDRIIVIKKVIANLSQNSEFLQMFEEEIKITVGLTHPSIIQIYDYGKVDDQYFMAMEYVEGKNLRQFVKRLADMKSMFSIDMSCHIISHVCHALAHAHSYKDRLTGKPLGIVHRDISPQNVMISYDGAVKLFDFGIAKAKSASEATRAGVIKGKPSYLSPEQINGEELDGRSDIFALGIVLWELLTAKRLFVAETDMGVLRLIQSAKIEPPSTFNPAVPQALDAIVLKSLTRDKNKRYQSAEEFQRDLHKFLYSFNPSFNPADLSYYAQELFKGEIREDRERLTKYLAMQPLDEGAGGELEKADPAKKGGGLSTKLADGLISTTDFNREMMDLVAKEGTDSAIRRPSDIQLMSSTNIGQPKTAATASPKSGLKVGTVPPPPARKPGAGDSMVIPPWSKPGGGGGGGNAALARAGTRTSSALRKELDTQGGSGRNVMVLLCVMIVAGVFAAREYGLLAGTPLDFLHPQEQRPKHAQGKSPDRTPAQTGADNQGQGQIYLKSNVDGFTVTVNGQETPVVENRISVPLHQSLNIEVTRPGHKSVPLQISVTRPETTVNIDLVKIPSGKLFLNTTPDADVTLFLGNTAVYQGRTPIRDHLLPVGKYHVVMQNSLINLRSEAEVVIEEGKITSVEKALGK